MIILKRAVAGIFFISGILFFIYIVLILLKGNFMFSFLGLIVYSAGVCIPAAIGSLLLASSMTNANNRFKVMRVFLIYVLIFYVILLANMLFWSRYRRVMAVMSITGYSRYNLNLIPFITIANYIQAFINDSINRSIVFQNILGNLFLFAPMGILLPCICKGLRRFGKFVAAMLVMLVCVEMCQLFVRVGSCDIDDVILNFAGASLFFCLFKLKMTQWFLRHIYIDV